MIKVSIEGHTEAIAAFDRLSRAASQPSVLMRGITQKGEDLTRQRFHTETTPQGSPWKDLSPSYLTYKRTKGYSTKRNQRTGRAYQLIRSRSEGEQAEITLNVPYLSHMQRMRPVFPEDMLPSSYEEAIGQIADRYFSDLVPTN
jgi:phage gpG-like protein